MTATWVVTTATEKVTLDQNRSGEATFTVTNQGTKVFKPYFDIRTGQNVDESWFTIDDSQRAIRPGASVPFLVKIQVGPTVPPGSYEFEARVTPPDAAPEENFVLSRRVLIEVPAPPKPDKKKFPWWIVVAAALLALVIGVVTWLAWPSGETPVAEPSTTPSPTASAAPVEYALVPRVEGQTVDNARKLLTDAGLAAGTISYRLDPRGTGITRQMVPPGWTVPKGSAIALEATGPMSRPVTSSPGNGSTITKGQWPTIAWVQPEQYVSRWVLVLQLETCTRSTTGGAEPCTYVTLDAPKVVTDKQFAAAMPKLDFTVKTTGSRHTGWVMCYIHPVDSLGTASDPVALKFFLDH